MFVRRRKTDILVLSTLSDRMSIYLKVLCYMQIFICYFLQKAHNDKFTTLNQFEKIVSEKEMDQSKTNVSNFL